MGNSIMNDETRLRQRMREYAGHGPGQRLSFEAVVTAGRRSRRRRRLAGAGCLTVGALVAGSLGAYAVGGPDTAARQTPPVAKTPTTNDKPADDGPDMSFMERPLTAEERRIGDLVADIARDHVPSSATVRYERETTLLLVNGHPAPPRVQIQLRVDLSGKTYMFAVNSLGRDPDGPVPDLSQCDYPGYSCDEPQSPLGRLVLMEQADDPYTTEARIYAERTKVLQILPMYSSRWSAGLWTAEEMGEIISDPDLLMREGTEGVDPRAVWTPPETDPGTPVDVADLQQDVRAAFAAGVQDRLDSGNAEAGEIDRRGRYYGGTHPDDAVEIGVQVDGERRISGVFTRGEATPADSTNCQDYQWGGQTCREVEINEGVILVTRSGHVDYDQDLGQQDMEVILVRDDGTGMRLTQYNFDPDDASSPGSAFPLTENDAVSLVQDPSLDYRG
jgi:hypothetical protein